MTLQQDTDGIRTTHIRSLPRASVKESVDKQAACGIDVVTDGEFSKPRFFKYIRERLDGFEARPGQKLAMRQGADLATKRLWS